MAVVEAMASGLPVVATDWDGLRESVLEGATGRLVPTVTGRFLDLFSWATVPHDVRREQVLRSQAVAFSIPAWREAVVELMSDDDRRRDWGRAARDRALELYDRGADAARLQDLLDGRGPVVDDTRSERPTGDDAFEHYPSEYLSARTRVMRGERITSPGALSITEELADVLRLDVARDILEVVAGRPTDLGAFLRASSYAGGSTTSWPDDPDVSTYAVCWLLKHGFLELDAARPPRADTTTRGPGVGALHVVGASRAWTATARHHPLGSASWGSASGGSSR